MPDADLDSVQLHGYVQRWQAGDSKAADELLRAVGHRLENLARRMLKGYPNVSAWVDTSDVFQGAVCRLLKTLEKLQPPTTRDFFNLAAAHVRRELLDLARRYRGKVQPGGGQRSAREPRASDSIAPGELEVWTRFHEAVERLPVEEREVFSLVLYHDWPQQDIADLLGVDVRTIRRRYNAASLKISTLLGGQLPEI